MALAAVSFAQTNNLKDYQGMTEEEKNINTIENIIENMDIEEQVDFMIEHIINENEAAARAEQFENITPGDSEIGYPPYANDSNDDTVVRSQESEVAQGWDDESPPVVLDYYGEEVP